LIKANGRRAGASGIILVKRINSKVSSSLSIAWQVLSISKGQWYGALILVLVAAIVLVKISGLRNPKKNNMPLITSVFALGKVQPIGYTQSINSPMIYSSSRIKKLYVEENDYVRKGSPLFSVEDSHDAYYNMEKSKAHVNQKRAELSSSQAQLLASKSLRDFYKDQYERYRYLVGTGAASLEKSMQQFTMYQANEQLYRSNLELVQANKAALASASWDYQSHKFKSEIATVRAPSNARVFKIYSRVGESIQGGRPVMDIGSTQYMGILAEVHRVDISKIKINQQASITVNGIPRIKWTGKVMRTSTQASSQSINPDDRSSIVANRVFDVLIKLSPQSSMEAQNFNYMEVNVLFSR
jgi:multidrug resistance efflux pump